MDQRYAVPVTLYLYSSHGLLDQRYVNCTSNLLYYDLSRGTAGRRYAVPVTQFDCFILGYTVAVTHYHCSEKYNRLCSRYNFASMTRRNRERPVNLDAFTSLIIKPKVSNVWLYRKQICTGYYQLIYNYVVPETREPQPSHAAIRRSKKNLLTNRRQGTLEIYKSIWQP